MRSMPTDAQGKGETMSTRTRVGLGMLIGVLLAALFLAATQPASTHGLVTFTTESPSVSPQGRTLFQKVKITHVRHRIRFTRLSSRSSGPCFRVDATVIGDNGLIDKIVSGTGHFHWCVEAQHSNRLIDKFSYANKDHSESWGWELDKIEANAGRGWSSTWCLSEGEQGPCFPVQYRYWRFTFRWSRLIGVFGQGVTLHKTLFAACTVRGVPGGYDCGTGEA